MLNKQEFEKEVIRILGTLVVGGRATVLALSGDLGAGKTTFTQILARELGVAEVVTSPTFVIMKTYTTTDARFGTLVHIDAYRLKSSRELEILGWYTMLDDPHTLICLEWPERVKDILPGGTRYITCTFIDEEHRDITSSIEC